MSDVETIARWMHDLHRKVNGAVEPSCDFDFDKRKDDDERFNEQIERKRNYYRRVAAEMLANPHPLLLMPVPEIVVR